LCIFKAAVIATWPPTPVWFPDHVKRRGPRTVRPPDDAVPLQLVKFRLCRRQLFRIQAAEFGGDGQPVLDSDVMLHVVLGDQWKPLVRVHDLRESPQQLLERRRPASDDSEMIGKDCELAVSTRRPAAMSTRRRKWRRKSTPMMGNCTSANRKVQAKRRPLKMRSVLRSP
jgi:hypothetical protein